MGSWVFYHINERDGKMTGGSRSVKNLVRGVKKLGITPIFVSQCEAELSYELRSCNIEVEIVSLPETLDVHNKKILRYPLTAKVRAAYSLLQYNQKIRRVAQEYEVRGIWARGLRSVLHVGLASWMSRIPLVWDIGVEPRPQGLLRLLFGVGFLLSDQVVTQATTQREHIFGRSLASWYSESFHTMYPGIASDRADRLQKSHEIPEDQPPEVISIGSIHPRKNQRMSLRAFEHVRRHHPNATLNFVGPVEDREYFESLRSYVCSHELDSSVQFLRWRDDVPELLGRSSILIISSCREGVPHVIREAMYAAVPVVATAVGGVPEAVQDGETGFLVPPDKPEEMGDRINYLLSHPGERERMGKAGFQFAKQRFSKDDWLSNYADLLRSIAEK